MRELQSGTRDVKLGKVGKLAVFHSGNLGFTICFTGILMGSLEELNEILWDVMGISLEGKGLQVIRGCWKLISIDY